MNDITRKMLETQIIEHQERIQEGYKFLTDYKNSIKSMEECIKYRKEQIVDLQNLLSNN